MGKNKKEKPELTLENLNRAIRTYQQLASLQNMEIDHKTEYHHFSMTR